MLIRQKRSQPRQTTMVTIGEGMATRSVFALKTMQMATAGQPRGLEQMVRRQLRRATAAFKPPSHRLLEVLLRVIECLDMSPDSSPRSRQPERTSVVPAGLETPNKPLPSSVAVVEPRLPPLPPRLPSLAPDEPPHHETSWMHLIGRMEFAGHSLLSEVLAPKRPWEVRLGVLPLTPLPVPYWTPCRYLLGVPPQAEARVLLRLQRVRIGRVRLLLERPVPRQQASSHWAELLLRELAKYWRGAWMPIERVNITRCPPQVPGLRVHIVVSSTIVGT
mmetsp:Transcript_5446/g.11469  ORF Transcript_5446/g.11469 Transcript_5446/m.11469 type:complete len:276 (-) Transcript_5446:143-970(-)